MEPEKQIYRAEINTIYLPIIHCTLITGVAVFSALFYKQDYQYHPKMLDAALIMGSVLVPILLLIFIFFIFFNRIIVDSKGISAISPYANPPKRNFICWDSVKKIRHKSVLGYEYILLISKADEKSVWVPKRIKDKNKFYHAVRSFAGNSNLFTLELMKS